MVDISHHHHTRLQTSGLHLHGTILIHGRPLHARNGGLWFDVLQRQILRSALGRFTSADTIIPGGVQGYDRFAYSNNNPIKDVDPDGHNPILIAIIAMSMFMLAGDTSRPVNEVASSSAPNITAEDIVDGIANVYELGVILSVGGPESAAEVFQDEVLDNLEFANTELKDSLSLGAGQIPVPGVDFVLDKLINDPAGTEQFQEAVDDLISQEYLDPNNNGALHVTYDGASYTTFDIGVDNLVTVNTIEFGTLNICGETSSVCNKISLSQNDAMITRKWLSNFNQEME